MVAEHLSYLLHQPQSGDDKYSRGVVGFVTGSERFPGAAILGVTAAMRTGVGMVRHVAATTVTKLLLEVRPEVVAGFGRAQAWVLGSGVPVDDELQVANILEAASQNCPLVIDAGALEVVDYSSLAPQTCILTPHAGELARLLDRFGKHFDLDYEAVVAAAAITNQVVMLKGNTTLIADPHGEVRAVGPNSPALATAGTGDVLAGILGSLLATNADGETDLLDIAELAVHIHSEAAMRAAEAGPVVALDVAEQVRTVIRDWMPA
ncbi:MAG: hypothetical protein RI919_1086 [Actinomycetota bacterium]|jgi:hydroxyethylthiazole kinase-like uncharacterized protein yjeF